MRRAIALALLAVTLSSCGHRSRSDATQNILSTEEEVANSAAPAEVRQSPMIADARELIDRAAATDAFVIATSRLALERSTAEPVKAIARLMIPDHEASAQLLDAAVGGLAEPLEPDATLPVDLQASLGGLKASESDSFDGAYARALISAHETALLAYNTYAVSGDVPPLKVYATEMVKRSSQHLIQLRALKF